MWHTNAKGAQGIVRVGPAGGGGPGGAEGICGWAECLSGVSGSLSRVGWGRTSRRMGQNLKGAGAESQGGSGRTSRCIGQNLKMVRCMGGR